LAWILGVMVSLSNLFSYERLQNGSTISLLTMPSMRLLYVDSSNNHSERAYRSFMEVFV